jgi:hypothetical protein
MLRQPMQCDAHINLTYRGVRATIVVLKKVINITYSECVSADTIIQYAKGMRRITLPSLACLVVLCISTLSRKGHDFGEKIVEHEMCFDSVYLI